MSNASQQTPSGWKPETIAGCFVLTLATVIWLGWACLYAIALLLESDGSGSWNLWVWGIVLLTYVGGPLLLWWLFVAVIRLGDPPKAP